MTTTALPIDFMARVVAWPGPDSPGYVNLHWLPPAGAGPKGRNFRGRPFKELTPFMEQAQWAASNPSRCREVFFCTSTQKLLGKEILGKATAFRNKSQALALKALWVDVDVKPHQPDKGYADLNEALRAATVFRTNAQMPPFSALVNSGGGLHLWWISKRPLTPAEWEPYAEGLKAELLKHGLKCDAFCTTDAARVMRVPGTFNNKLYPDEVRPVKLLWLGDDYDFDADPAFQRLKAIAPAKVTATVSAASPYDMTNFPPNGMHPLLQGVLNPTDMSLSEGIDKGSDMPLEIEQVKNACLHFQDCEANHGRGHAEPLWQLTLLACSFFEGGRDLAHRYSDGHPNYTEGETDQKYEQKLVQRAQGNLGWPACSTFEANGAPCKKCPFYGKVKSPLNLAERVAAPLTSLATLEDIEDLSLPDGYILDEKGIINEIVTKTYGNGMSEQLMYPLFFSRIRKPVLQGGTRRAMLFDTSLDLNNWGDATLPEADLASEQKTLQALRDCGVKPFPRNQSRIIQFMTSWTARLDAAKARIQTIPFGWLHDGVDGMGKEIGFAYGGKVFMADGTEQAAGYSDAVLERYYRPRGQLEVWYEALKVVTEQCRPELETIILTSFASVLMALTGKNNCVLCATSPQSGGGKTTSQHIGLAVWGHPRMTKESPTSSQKGIIHKMGILKNLPIFWDEISDEAKMDQVRSMLGITTEGGGATVLHQNRTFFEKDDWQLLMLLGSNKSLVQNILRTVHDTDAPLQRVFEFIVPRLDNSPRRESDVTLLINSLDHNYGKPGLLYGSYIGHNVERVRELVLETQRKFEDAVDHRNEERFRLGAVACIYAAAVICNEHMNTGFHLPELWEFLSDQYHAQRKVIDDAEVVGGTATNTINAVTAFMKAHSRHALWVERLPPADKVGRPNKWAIAYIEGPCRARPDRVDIRLSVTDRTIEISRTRFEQFLDTLGGHSFSAVFSGLKRHYGAIIERRVNLATGAGVLGGRETVIHLPVPNGSPFEDELFRHATTEQRLEMGLGAEGDVTAAVTGTRFVKAADPKPTGITAAIEQATADLNKVRDAS